MLVPRVSRTKKQTSNCKRENGRACVVGFRLVDSGGTPQEDAWAMCVFSLFFFCRGALCMYIATVLSYVYMQ